MDEKCCICNKKLIKSGVFTIKNRKYCAKCAKAVVKNGEKVEESEKDE